MFSFLWLGSKPKGGIHLVNWKKIYISKKLGSWGIINILWFSSSVAMKSLCRGLFVQGFWSDVIREKYLKNMLVVEWIRRGKNWIPSMSICWKGLAWKVGRGDQVLLEIDPFIGEAKVFRLSLAILTYLINFGIGYMDQIKNIGSGQCGQHY